MPADIFQAKGALKTSYGEVFIYRLEQLEKAGLTQLDRLPYTIRILLESLLRRCDERQVTSQEVIKLARWQAGSDPRPRLPFLPARLIMQDYTGLPALVDLAAMRSAVVRQGGDPQRVNPVIPVDLVIDHSVQVDFFASPDAMVRNSEMEMQRNRQRFEFLRWAEQAFDHLRLIPPSRGILHQVNLEYLAEVVLEREQNGELIAFPDTLLGTDSHTTMINGLGVLGWGVGGIEAEATMLGQPVEMLAPEVMGLQLRGCLSEGATATDLALTVTQMLRQKGVVGKFVEFCGPGVQALGLPDRATLANMAPEYGATSAFFPVDDETLRYLRLTGRSAELIERVERYCKEQGLFRTETSPEPEYGEVVELDLAEVQPSLAGPKRPQDRIPMGKMKHAFHLALNTSPEEHGYALTPEAQRRSVRIGTNGHAHDITHGSVVIAAITSCANTSNPALMIAAGLLARKAVQRGLRVRPYIKTSLAPGSRAVSDYLHKADLLAPLAKLGFNLVGYGCTTCIGNSGPLPGDVVKAITNAGLVVVSVLSGNRNFEGRIHPFVRASYLASPPLVVAYALAGTVDIDLTHEPLGSDQEGDAVFLRDIWPTSQEVKQVIEECLGTEMFQSRYAEVFSGSNAWKAIPVGEGELYEWDEASTYIREPPFFEMLDKPSAIREIRNARALVFLGNSVSTDCISPAGDIPIESPAGRYLLYRGVRPGDFNTYGARRGNDRVMVRGTFANIRLKNRLLPGSEGGLTLHLPGGEQTSIYEAAMKYQEEGVPLVVLAGKDYGGGPGRDWAAKGTRLLGIRAVLAESFERIHRSNLADAGVLPLQYLPDENADSFGLTGMETFNIEGLSDDLQPQARVTVKALREDGKVVTFYALVRLDTLQEVAYYRDGGRLVSLLRHVLE